MAQQTESEQKQYTVDVILSNDERQTMTVNVVNDISPYVWVSYEARRAAIEQFGSVQRVDMATLKAVRKKKPKAGKAAADNESEAITAAELDPAD